MSSAQTDLSPASILAIAEKVVELLADRETPSSPDRYLTAAEVAERFAVDREYVYDNADELGAIRLGNGPKARLRFDPERVHEALGVKPFSTPPAKSAPPKRRRSATPSTDLLPIGGKR